MLQYWADAKSTPSYSSDLHFSVFQDRSERGVFNMLRCREKMNNNPSFQLLYYCYLHGSQSPPCSTHTSLCHQPALYTTQQCSHSNTLRITCNPRPLHMPQLCALFLGTLLLLVLTSISELSGKVETMTAWLVTVLLLFNVTQLYRYRPQEDHICQAQAYSEQFPQNSTILQKVKLGIEDLPPPTSCQPLKEGHTIEN